MLENENIAVLSSKNEYSTFTFRGQTLTFLTSKSLLKYTEVKQWDDGYLVVMAKYASRPEEEEYIDLKPILNHLYMDAKSFLSPIKEVVIQYA